MFSLFWRKESLFKYEEVVTIVTYTGAALFMILYLENEQEHDTDNCGFKYHRYCQHWSNTHNCKIWHQIHKKVLAASAYRRRKAQEFCGNEQMPLSGTLQLEAVTLHLPQIESFRSPCSLRGVRDLEKTPAPRSALETSHKISASAGQRGMIELLNQKTPPAFRGGSKSISLSNYRQANIQTRFYWLQEVLN